MSSARGHSLRLVVAAVGALAIATGAVALLEDAFDVPNASAIYLVAVVFVAWLVGTGGAILTAFGSAALYNFLFTEPRYTFVIHDSGVLLSVVLLLFVGIVVGQLAAMQRQRAEVATAHEREARTLFAISRALATRTSMGETLDGILAALRDEAGLERAWIGIGADPAAETAAADTGDGRPSGPPVRFRVLQRMPGEQPARWVVVQRPGIAGRPAAPEDTYRVRIEASGEPLGSIWATRSRTAGEPDEVQTRLLAATADQVGQAITFDRAAEQSRAADVARQSDALKSALLQSVSHDLRTPLATIRAVAGSLRPGGTFSDADRQAGADAIEREVEYLDRLVTNLLDLSRIEAGALRPKRELFDLDDLLSRALGSTRARLGERRLETALQASTGEVDPVFVDEAVANVLDNAVKYTPDGALVRISASDLGPDRVLLTVEDDGPGVPDEVLPRLFEKFYRAPRARQSARQGTGIGLAVVRGLVQATGGSVTARRSELGGLAIDMELPARRLPATVAAGTSPAVDA
jgi:two-component system sensor histidine kinase KdpD